VMGALSSLIVTACVAPPLVATLAVIGQSGDVIRGSAALFALSMGMGAPLLVIGTSAGKWLPKAGAWMNAVKVAFGFIFLGVALWMLDRLVPARWIFALWALLIFSAGYCLFARMAPARSRAWNWARKEAGVVAMLYAVLVLTGVILNRAAPLDPSQIFRPSTQSSAVAVHLFKRIKTVADLDRELKAARVQGKPAMLDFYADWCVSCKEMEKYVFDKPDVRAALDRGVLLQADVTANDAEDTALLHRFGIFGPPTIVFFAANGNERREYRIVGFMPADRFLPHVEHAFAADPASASP